MSLIDDAKQALADAEAEIAKFGDIAPRLKADLELARAKALALIGSKEAKDALAAAEDAISQVAGFVGLDSARFHLDRAVVLAHLSAADKPSGKAPAKPSGKADEKDEEKDDSAKSDSAKPSAKK